MTRGLVTVMNTPDERQRFLEKMQQRLSRTLMASGGNEPVVDEGGLGHSVFAEEMISGLLDMEKGQFTAAELFYEHIKEKVSGNSAQVPKYNTIRNSGHNGGDFVFVRR